LQLLLDFSGISGIAAAQADPFQREFPEVEFDDVPAIKFLVQKSINPLGNGAAK
jgi:hypothetical protein